MTLQAAGSTLDSVRKELAAIVLEAYRTHPLAGWEDRLRIIQHCLAGTDDLTAIADILARWTEQLAASLDYPRPVPDSKKNLQLQPRGNSTRSSIGPTGFPSDPGLEGRRYGRNRADRNLRTPRTLRRRRGEFIGQHRTSMSAGLALFGLPEK